MVLELIPEARLYIIYLFIKTINKIANFYTEDFETWPNCKNTPNIVLKRKCSISVYNSFEILTARSLTTSLV